jgi:hypothetical protein
MSAYLFIYVVDSETKCKVVVSYFLMLFIVYFTYAIPENKYIYKCRGGGAKYEYLSCYSLLSNDVTTENN